MQTASGKFLDNLEDYQKALGLRIFYLVLNGVLKRACSGFSTEDKESMDRIFSGDDNNAKRDFIEKYIPNFDELFDEESKKVEKEIETEIEKQI